MKKLLIILSVMAVLNIIFIIGFLEVSLNTFFESFEKQEEVLNWKIENEILHAYGIINKHFESDGDYKDVDILLENIYDKLDLLESEGDFKWQGNGKWEFSALTHDSWETMDMYCTVNQDYHFEGWCTSLPNECMIFNQAYEAINRYENADYNFYSIEEALDAELELEHNEDYFIEFQGPKGWEFQLFDPSYEEFADPYPRIYQDYEVESCYNPEI